MLNILNAINAIADFLLHALKGIINYLQELIPLVGKTVFLASPFLLTIFIAYLFRGFWWAGGATVAVALIIWWGMSLARRQQIKDSQLTFGVVVCVCVIDILLGVGLFWVMSMNEKARVLTALVNDDFNLKVVSCNASAGTITCDLEVTNAHPEQRWFGIDAASDEYGITSIEDEAGSIYNVSLITMSETRSDWGQVFLGSRETARATLKFYAPPMPKIVAMSLLCGTAAAEPKKWKNYRIVTFRNLGLAEQVSVSP